MLELNHSVIGSVTPTNVSTNTSDLGKLQSQMTVLLHTFEAIGLFNGSRRNEAQNDRKSANGKTYTPHNMIMLSGALMLMEGDIRRDNPYADYWFDTILNRITELDEELDNRIKSLTSYMQNKVPEGFSSTSPESTKPAAFAVRSGSRGYYKFLYVVLKVDTAVRLISLAHHICLFDTNAKWQHIKEIMGKCRSIISAAASYRHFEVERNDVAANNQRAQRAHESYSAIGIVPTPQHMSGEVRNPFAPEIYSAKIRETAEPGDAYVESESSVAEVEVQSVVHNNEAVTA